MDEFAAGPGRWPIGYPTTTRTELRCALRRALCCAVSPGESVAASLTPASRNLVTERSGDDVVLATARFVQGLVLLNGEGSERSEGLALLGMAGEAAVAERFTMAVEPAIDIQFDNGEILYRGAAVLVLVECLLNRGAEADLAEARAATDRLAAVPTEPDCVLHELPLLLMRALLARARGDQAAYHDYVVRYREMAYTCECEGHIAAAEAMR